MANPGSSTHYFQRFLFSKAQRAIETLNFICQQFFSECFILKLALKCQNIFTFVFNISALAGILL